MEDNKRNENMPHEDPARATPSPVWKWKPYRYMTPEEQQEFRFSDPRGTIFNGVMISDAELGFPPDFDDPEDPPEPTPEQPRPSTERD